MPARFLIRLDDACPTMDRSQWSQIEAILDRFNIKPIVAVVPDNRDEKLMLNAPDSGFWDHVQQWQAKGWTIALHGYQHLFHSVSRNKLILPFYDRSEFGGLSYELQAQKLEQAWRICHEHGIKPSVWIAPAHCFDRDTLQALKDTTPIRIISDGIACDQFYQDGFYWLPQQLWQLKPRSTGLWTVCLHPNSMKEHEINELESLLSLHYYAKQICAVSDLALSKRRQGLVDAAYQKYFWLRSNMESRVAWLKQALSLG